MGQPAKDAAGSRAPAAFSPTQAAAATLAAVAVGAAASGVWAFSTPATVQQPDTVSYRQSGRFSYDAATARNIVYPAGRLTSPAPIFSPLVSSVAVRFAYRLTVPQGRVEGGRAGLEAVLSSSNGWTRRWPLAPPLPFHGASATVTGTLHVSGLFATIAQVQSLTKDTTDSYTLSLVPQVQAQAVAGTRLLTPVFHPVLRFFIQPSWLQLTLPASASAGAILHPLASRSVAFPVTVAHTVNLLGHPVPAPFLRVTAPLLAFLTAAGAGLLLRTEARRLQQLGETSRVARQYRGLLVDVDSLPFSPTARSIRVGSIEGLVKLAEQCERMILHARGEEGQHLYLLENVGESYYCILHEDAPPPPVRTVPAPAAETRGAPAAPPVS
ncbi:exported protein of unknown function [Candidatus Hydrogenisulfobacillus filiaventi]|uniref:DUF5305 domain-containing protein n=1 Tax=Candidatus Hydrogenisulfobacillus filiaventi TaxID=2707344 RepID=A0A6F8ZK50_9FIRM|nr:exported protein of unknown function [Candidatus Hydrogenisulfobacillus filiaventi]